MKVIPRSGFLTEKMVIYNDVEVGQLWRISAAVQTRGSHADSGGTDRMFCHRLNHRKRTVFTIL